MKIIALGTMPVLLVGCSATSPPVACSMEVAQAWEFTNVPCMERGRRYSLPGGNQELVVLELPDGDYSKCLAFRDAAGQFVPLAEGERSFGYAWCRHNLHYVLVFNDFASRQNQVLLYKIGSAKPLLCWDSVTCEAEQRVSWHVASWGKQGILLEGDAEDASRLYRLLPLE